MGSLGLVIVAIPEEQDRVWKISSQQVPHLTLLYLGDDSNQVQNLDQIMQFVEHAVTLSEHGPFYLDVERRGTLGEDDADVLFFNKRGWNLKWIRQFRGQLLQNQAVRTAFDATAQHLEAPQEWLPHLTMGYPDTPAKPLPDVGFDHPIYSVCFDRIAVWAEDFNGPEFQLEWPERELEGDLAVAYSESKKAALIHNSKNGIEDTMSGTAVAERGEQFVEHHGVKGMKWGVRNAARGVGNVIRDAPFHAKANSTGNIRRLVSNAAQKTKNEDLPGINAKYAAKGAKVHANVHLQSLSKVPVQKQYREEVKSAYLKRLNEAANETTSRSGKFKYEIVKPTFGKEPSVTRWRVRSTRVQHALEQEEFDIIPVFDEDGFITDFKHEEVDTSNAVHSEELDLESTLSHGAAFVGGLVNGSTESVGEQFLIEHFGIKGMRWGFRREPPKAVAPTAKSVVPHGSRRKTKVEREGGENHPAVEDAIKVEKARAKLKKSGPKALTNNELRDVAERLRLEEQAVQADRSQSHKWIRKFLGNQGNQAANQVVRTEVDSVIRGRKNK